MEETKHPSTAPDDLAQLGLTCSVPTAARLLGIGRATAYKAAAAGLIPSIRLGRRVVVPTAALKRLLDAGAVLSEGADPRWG